MPRKGSLVQYLSLLIVAALIGDPATAVTIALTSPKLAAGANFSGAQALGPAALLFFSPDSPRSRVAKGVLGTAAAVAAMGWVGDHGFLSYLPIHPAAIIPLVQTASPKLLGAGAAALFLAAAGTAATKWVRKYPGLKNKLFLVDLSPAREPVVPAEFIGSLTGLYLSERSIQGALWTWCTTHPGQTEPLVTYLNSQGLKTTFALSVQNVYMTDRLHPETVPPEGDERHEDLFERVPSRLGPPSLRWVPTAIPLKGASAKIGSQTVIRIIMKTDRSTPAKRWPLRDPFQSPVRIDRSLRTSS